MEVGKHSCLKEKLGACSKFGKTPKQALIRDGGIRLAEEGFAGEEVRIS